MPEEPSAALIDSGQGQAVLMLHGWGASKELYQPLLRFFPSYRSVVPDLPGFGDTPRPAAPWATDDYVNWVIALLDRLQLASVHLIGHSHGGRIAIRLAASHPQRVAKLVLVAAAGIRPKRGWAYRLRTASYKLMRKMENAALLPSGLRRLARERADRRGSSDYRAASGVMRSTLVRLVNEDFRADLPKISAATLLIWGDKDDETPLANGRLMERTIPDAGLVVFNGRGHFAYLEEPARFASIVNTFFQQS